MKKKSVWLSAVLLLMAVLMSGCVRAPIGGGGATRVSGVVELGDTGLPLRASVTIGTQVITAENGHFTAMIRPGTHQYSVVTLLGTHSGTITVSPGKDVVLRVPEFSGFDVAEYNAFLLWAGQLRRWENDRVIKVWIENDSDTQEQHRNKAWNALLEWQNVLHDEIVFTKIDERSKADLEILWDSLSDLDGKCEFVIYDGATGYIEHARMTISLSYKNSDRTYLHQAGHCIGLNHPINSTYVMSNSGGAVSIHPDEANYARLLYSLPSTAGEI